MSEIFAKGIGLIIAIVVSAAITGFFVMILWNALIPGIFNLRQIDFMEAWGLSILCNMLFKSEVSFKSDKE